MAFQQDPRSSRPCNWRFLVFPRRGPPAAAIKVPRGYCPEDLTTRQPRGVKPRGTLRGGPERPADDPQRKPRGGLCGGPARSAKEPRTPSKITRQDTTGGKAAKGNEKTLTRPTIITVDRSGMVRRWGQLSRASALRAGCYWEDMDRTAKVYLAKDQKRTEVLVVWR